MVIQHTVHSTFRSALRGLYEDEIEHVFQFASHYLQEGALIYYLWNQDSPTADRRWDWVILLAETALVFDKVRSILLTVWRNRLCDLKLICKKESNHFISSEVGRA